MSIRENNNCQKIDDDLGLAVLSIVTFSTLVMPYREVTIHVDDICLLLVTGRKKNSVATPRGIPQIALLKLISH